MRVGVVSINLHFFGDIERAFRDAGDTVVHYSEGEDAKRFAESCDVIFGEFAQSPIQNFCNGSTPLYVRVHRIEMYQATARLDWSGCRIMWFSAQHVMDRFLERVAAPPIQTEISPTNLTPSFMSGRTRRATKPYRAAIIGRWAMKKRVYTALQLMAPRLIAGDWELWLIGDTAGSPGYGGAEYSQNVMDLVDELGVKNNVRVTGRLDGSSYHDALRACDVVLSMSNEEGTHVSVAEAMAAGCVPFVHGWRGAAYIYPGVFTTFDQFDRMLSAWENYNPDEKQRESEAASEWMLAKGAPQEEARRIVRAIHRDCHELEASGA